MRLQDGKTLLRAALAVGLVLRAGVFLRSADLGTPIVDEQHYTRIAANLMAGYGFAWGPGELTSIRPPLYPAFVASIWSVAGDGNLQAIRLVQMLLSAGTAGLVFLIGRRVFSPLTGRVAAAVVWLYPSAIFFNVTILTETLYTFLLTLFVFLTVMLVETPRRLTAVGAGLALGFGCLTRSSLWPLPLLLAPLFLIIIRGPFVGRVAAAALFVVAYVAVVAPWAVRNTRLQGVLTIVDTMGGLNLRMGNYEHTPEDRMWAAVDITGEQSWANGMDADNAGRPLTEGEKDRWAQRKALAYMIANPGTTIRRSLIRVADFWGLEREYVAGIARGLYTPGFWVGSVVSLAIVMAFVLVAIFGVVGMWLAGPASWRAHVALLLPALAIMGVHSLVFAHSRYHIPIIPVLSLYAASLWSSRLTLTGGRVARVGAAASAIGLVAVWARQLIVVDAARIEGFLRHVR